MSGRPAKSPDVSVVVSVYNGERFLREAVDSVLAQTLSDFELIVIDDGSADSTPDLLASYAARDAREVVERQPDQGRAAALNRGFALARAPLVARLDADDIASRADSSASDDSSSSTRKWLSSAAESRSWTATAGRSRTGSIH